MDDNAGHAWSLLSDEVLKDYPIYLSKAVKRFLDEIETRDSLHRVQAVVDEHNELAHRWIRWLGFEYEQTLYDDVLGGYGNRCLYARVNQC